MLGEKVMGATIFPHLHMLSYTKVQCYLPFWRVHLSNHFPTPAHAVTHTSAVLFVICHSGRYTLTNSSPHLRMLSYTNALLSTIPAGTL